MTRKSLLALGFAGMAMSHLALPARAQYTMRSFETVYTTQVQVLTSGPVHEAFAETVVYDPEPDVVVLAPPPPPINEAPPSIMPTGPNMTWISGYWVWDDDRDDYLWVSGIWRSVPPGRSYVPGFWTRVGHGYQWSSGFWVDSDSVDIEYLPEPPEPIEVAPPPRPPSPNLIWTPGLWVWEFNRYVWRPGNWVEASPDWVWVPAHYVWSPRGYVFVDGYWDLPIEQRGVLFAPVYVSPIVRRSPMFVYAPQTVISLEVFTDHLFVRPRYRHYYFGDYYSTVYVDRGIYPWFEVNTRRVAYDPIYVHRSWRHRNEPDWERQVHVTFNRRRENERERPPRYLSAQVNIGDRAELAVKGLIVAKSYQQLAQSNQNRYRSVPQDERNVIVQRARNTTKAREERKSIETSGVGGFEPSKPQSPTRAKMPAPTVTSRKDASPGSPPAPKKPEPPSVDRTVAPKPKAPVQKVTREPRTPGAAPATPTRVETQPGTPPSGPTRGNPAPPPDRSAPPEGKQKKDKDD